MNPTEVTYPVFEANQVLTNAHLNDLFEYLDGPVKRVAALDCPVAYAPVLEETILPGSADVLNAIRDLAAY